MRIISGSFKGKKFLEPKDKQTRPLKDLTKESIFNVITHSNKFKIDFNNSTILDLFSGVGSFGLECLSRGVKEVFFVENYIGVLPILEKNLSNLKSINNYKLIKKDEKILAVGGRVLNFVSLSNDFKIAKKNVEENLIKLNWTGGFFRKDIGYKVIE